MANKYEDLFLLAAAACCTYVLRKKNVKFLSVWSYKTLCIATALINFLLSPCSSPSHPFCFDD